MGGAAGGVVGSDSQQSSSQQLLTMAACSGTLMLIKFVCGSYLSLMSVSRLCRVIFCTK